MEKQTQKMWAKTNEIAVDQAHNELEEMLNCFQKGNHAYLTGAMLLRDIVDSKNWKLLGEYHTIDDFFSDRLPFSRSKAWDMVKLVRTLQPWFAKKTELMEIDRTRLRLLAPALKGKTEEEQSDLVVAALEYPTPLFHEKIKVAQTGIEPETCPHIHRKIVCCDCGRTLEKFKNE